MTWCRASAFNKYSAKMTQNPELLVKLSWEWSCGLCRSDSDIAQPVSSLVLVIWISEEKKIIFLGPVSDTAELIVGVRKLSIGWLQNYFITFLFFLLHFFLWLWISLHSEPLRQPHSCSWLSNDTAIEAGLQSAKLYLKEQLGGFRRHDIVLFRPFDYLFYLFFQFPLRQISLHWTSVV